MKNRFRFFAILIALFMCLNMLPIAAFAAGGEDNTNGGGDNVTSYTVTYEIVNGTWSDDSTGNKTETVVSGQKPANVPTNMKPGTGCTGGTWNTDPAGATITADITFTYSFTAPPTSYTVTYEIVNGTWSDDSTGNKTETVVSGQKPANVPTNMKPGTGCTGGTWNTDPAGATITADITFIYSFTAEIPATTYTVTVTSGDHGSASANPTSGEQGTAVTLTANPNDGYKFKEWTGADSLTFISGSKTSATAIFTMPAQAVSVTATFEQVTYVVTVNAPTHGKVSVDNTSAPKDGTVTISITPDSGYELDNLLVKDPAGNIITVSNNTFKMPECNVTVTATFKAAPAKSVTYTITGGANGYWIKGTGLYYTITAKRSTADSECINHFTGVMIDNSILPITDYTIKSGSTVVTIKPYALQRLSVGVHTVSLWFDDGIASTFIYIWADPRYPATGDERQTATWAALTGVTFVGMAAVVVLGRMYWKKQKNK
ncbi:MAG: hypothetical protein K5771_00320 [Oscillospiraceae bacterium]|nr:hypothetical protein [Oscillospiraceae bacterium]